MKRGKRDRQIRALERWEKALSGMIYYNANQERHIKTQIDILKRKLGIS